MEATLTPALALDYLRELSTDLRAAAVLDAAGSPLAGPPDVLPAVKALVTACPDAEALQVETPDGSAFLQRSAGHTLALAAGPLALPRLVLHDMAAVLALLSATGAPAMEIEATPPVSLADRYGGTVVRWCERGGSALVLLDPGDPRHAAVASAGAAVARAAAPG